MAKFKAEPGLHIMDQKTKSVLCRFDEDGFFETDDQKIITKLAPWFEIVKNPEVKSQPKPKKGR